jgi:triacylglycerol lipase
MLARSMLAWLAIEVGAYAWLAVHLLAGGAPIVAVVSVVAALHFVVLRASVPLLGFAIAAAVGGRPEPSLGAAARVRLVLRECRAFWLNYTLVPLEPFLAPEPPLGRVVLVHGILCNRAIWHGFRRRLAARGLTCHAVTIEPLLGEIDAMADALAARLRRAEAPPVIVAHSLGGLVTRRMMQRAPDVRLAGVVTIATPHEGAVQAALAFGAAGRSLRRGGPWLRSLQQGPTPPPDLPRVAIATWHDELVSPPDSAFWPGADRATWSGVGHIDLLWSDDVAERVAFEIRRMLGADPAAAPSRPSP